MDSNGNKNTSSKFVGYVFLNFTLIDMYAILRKIYYGLKVEVKMFIKKENLTIRNATQEDASTLCNWWNDGEVMAHAGFPNGLSTTEEVVAKQILSNTDDTHRVLIIEDDDKPIGEMNYRNKGNNIAEIGIKICDFSKQEKGYGKILISMLIDSLFKEYGYREIILDTNLNNLRAQHFYEKLGFKKVRVNMDAYKNQLGELESVVEYKLTEQNFISYLT